MASENFVSTLWPNAYCRVADPECNPPTIHSFWASSCASRVSLDQYTISGAQLKFPCQQGFVVEHPPAHLSFVFFHLLQTCLSKQGATFLSTSSSLSSCMRYSSNFSSSISPFSSKQLSSVIGTSTPPPHRPFMSIARSLEAFRSMVASETV